MKQILYIFRMKDLTIDEKKSAIMGYLDSCSLDELLLIASVWYHLTEVVMLFCEAE